MFRRVSFLTAVVAVALVLGPAPAAPLEFRLTFDPAAHDKPFTGRVFVMLSARDPGGLPSGPNWFRPEPFFARDVTDWKPGEPLTISGDALACPKPLNELAKGDYYVLAVMDRDLGGMSFAASPGNVYAKAARHTLDPAVGGPIDLKLDKVYEGRKFPESDTVKLVDIESELLTKFVGRPTRMRAGVVLPPSFAKEPARKYPVVYSVPGFSGSHFGAVMSGRAWDIGGVEFVYVVLDPSCRLGHHVFADSANNGPCGAALVKELIPHIEKTYRIHGVPATRFVTGGSSGGWSSLWLQVTYPEVFGGCWSLCPDPVDFRDFQRIDLTSLSANMYVEPNGDPRPLSRASGGRSPLYFKAFSAMETVMGHGGQLESFEAVFSPRGPDGKPRRLWDRTTGAIDPAVAKSWEPYDIRLTLERNWATLGPKLAGKLHVYMGDIDTFYLDGATRLLQKSMRDLSSDAAVEMYPGKDHSTIGPATRDRVRKEMVEAYRRWEAAAIKGEP
ncbi:MAG: alpha/beta hydrolase-fold protein [Gemmataceae bacterium]